MHLPAWPDTRLALRQIAHTPAITLLSVLSVAVGVGLPTAAFTVVNGAFLRPLPVPDGERIMHVVDYHREGYNVYITTEEFVRRAERARSFTALAAYVARTLPLESPGFATRVTRGAFVSPTAFEILGVRPAVGRGLRAGDDRPGGGAAPVVVLGDDVWRAQFGAAPDIIGKAVRVGSEWRTVVGVMPAGLRFPHHESFWVALQRDAGATSPPERVSVFGKLRADVTIREAEAELRAIAYADDSGTQRVDLTQRVIPFTRGRSGPGDVHFLFALVTVLTLLLVVAAANVANLMLARNATRSRELAIRSALGAGRRRLIGQLWLETFALSVLGAVVGVIAARAGVRWFTQKVFTSLPWWADFSIDLPVLAFAFGLTLLAATVAGLAPAFKVTRAPLADVLKSGAHSISGIRFGRLSGAMIVTEFAISVGLLGAAAMLGRGLLGFSYERFNLPGHEVLVSQVYFGQPQVRPDASPEQRRAAWREFVRDADARLARVEDALQLTPGVRLISRASTFPGNEIEDLEQLELEVPGAQPRRLSSRVAAVGERYFELLDARVVAGRDFLRGEYAEPVREAIVNEPFVRRHFQGRSPLGARLRSVFADGVSPWMEIVGVVPDLGLNPGDPTRADGVYMPLAPSSFVRLAIRADGDPRELIAAVHQTFLREAPEARVQWTVTLQEQLGEVAQVFRGIGIGLLALGLVALLLSAASIYAIVAFSVTQRTRELGIRLALGATSSSLVRTIVAAPARQVFVGAAAGLGLAVVVMQVVKIIPFDLQPGGGWLTGAFAAVMVVAGLSASLLPARRTLRIQPMDALRSD